MTSFTSSTRLLSPYEKQITHPYALDCQSLAIYGLQQQASYTSKVRIISACCFPLLVPIGIAIKAHCEKKRIDLWIDAFTKFNEAKFEEAEKLFLQHITRKNGVMQIDDLSQNVFRVFNVRRGEASRGFSIESFIGQSLLLCKYVKGKDKLTALDKEQIEFIRDQFSHQRCGIWDYQKKMVAYLLDESQEVIKIPIPRVIHAEYAILIEIFDWFLNDRFAFNEDGSLAMPIGAGLEDLDCWQKSAAFAKEELIKKGMYGELERNFIEPLVAAKTSKEMITHILDYGKKHHEEFRQKFVIYANPKHKIRVHH